MLKILVLCEVLCTAGMIGGCDVGDGPLEMSAVRDIGLPASGVPPFGEGIAPSGGRGGDGSPVVTAVGGWSGGPGAVRWHGGQWVMSYQAAPGSTLLNVSCDVVPSPTATDLIELVSSNGQVLGSNTVPATTANIVIRSWILLSPGHQVVDGEQVVLRHSPRDSATGAWTGSAQDLAVINCAANTQRRFHTYKLSPLWGANLGSGGFQIFNGRFSGNWQPVASGDLLDVALPVQDGERFESISASVYGNTAYTVTMSTIAQDDAFHIGSQLGGAQTSTAQNSLQTLTVVPIASSSGGNELVTSASRSYWLQFIATKTGSGDGGSLFVGPLTLVTSTTN